MPSTTAKISKCVMRNVACMGEEKAKTIAFPKGKKGEAPTVADWTHVKTQIIDMTIMEQRMLDGEPMDMETPLAAIQSGLEDMTLSVAGKSELPMKKGKGPGGKEVFEVVWPKHANTTFPVDATLSFKYK